MGVSPYLRHGQSKHNQPRSCHGVHEWQLHFSQNKQSFLLHGCRPAHERNNAVAPELVRMTSEFEASQERKHNKSLDTSHHDQVFPDDFWKTGQIPD